MSLSRSEAAKLNTQKSRDTSKRMKDERISRYLEKPKLCLECNKIIPYEKRNNKFCSQSCGAYYSNARKDWSNIITGPTKADNLTGEKKPREKKPREKKPREKKPREKKPREKKTDNVCLSCGINIQTHRKYCSLTCQARYRYNILVEKWCNGEYINKRVIKKWLAENFGYKCSVCGIERWNDKPITLELEHKDGNSENNTQINLCLICPNCHSQTDTYKGKNKGNGRYFRRQRYKEGRSY